MPTKVSFPSDNAFKHAGLPNDRNQPLPLSKSCIETREPAVQCSVVDIVELLVACSIRHGRSYIDYRTHADHIAACVTSPQETHPSGGTLQFESVRASTGAVQCRETAIQHALTRARCRSRLLSLQSPRQEADHTPRSSSAPRSNVPHLRSNVPHLRIAEWAVGGVIERVHLNTEQWQCG